MGITRSRGFRYSISQLKSSGDIVTVTMDTRMTAELLQADTYPMMNLVAGL
jgi:hypothetical protein